MVLADVCMFGEDEFSEFGSTKSWTLGARFWFVDAWTVWLFLRQYLNLSGEVDGVAWSSASF